MAIKKELRVQNHLNYETIRSYFQCGKNDFQMTEARVESNNELRDRINNQVKTLLCPTENSGMLLPFR